MRGLKAVLLGTWLLFISYSFFLAPVDGNEGYLTEFLTLNAPDPLLLAVFSLLGVYPAVFSILLLENDKATIPAWPFALGSFLLGAFSLLPYFIFHKDRKGVQRNRTSVRLQAIVNSSSLQLALLTITIFLMVYGLFFGSLETYSQAFYESRLVHVMTIDFLVLTCLAVLGIYHHAFYKNPHLSSKCWLGMVPIIGPLLYLYISKQQAVPQGEKG